LADNIYSGGREAMLHVSMNGAADTIFTVARCLIPMYTRLSKHFIRKPLSTACI